jgi:hypothetical protein
MTIYTSTKAVPYVYICTHKETNQFYIGYREANVRLNIPSHLDLPEYKTSSKVVNPEWENYTWTIVAEFFDPSCAYTFEQQLICDNWKNPLLLNGHYNLGENQFRTSGPNGRKGKPNGRKGKPNGKKGIPTGPNGKKGKPNGKKGIPTRPHSTETKQKLRDANLGKPSPKKGKPSGPSPLKGKPNGRKGIPSPLKGKPNGRKGKSTGQIPWNKGIPSLLKGIPRSEETKQKISDAAKGRIYKLVTCPHCGLVGKGGNMTRYHFDNCKFNPLFLISSF